MSMASTLAHVHIQINGLRWPSASVLIACLALAFTIASFWWINARQGQLKSFEPHTFAAVLRQHDLVTLLLFPLVLHNTGAKPIVVQVMRLSFPKESRSDLPLPWRARRSHIKPGGKDDSHEFPAVFSIPGRTAHQMFIEFGGPFPGVIPTARDYQALIEVKLGHRKKWKRLLRFTISLGFSCAQMMEVMPFGSDIASSSSPAGGSPVRVAARRPGSRLAASGETPGVEAQRRKPFGGTTERSAASSEACRVVMGPALRVGIGSAEPGKSG